ncbi:MAG: hypothetical protein SNJ57_13310 [Cyanobacteriota bacterium]
MEHWAEGILFSGEFRANLEGRSRYRKHEPLNWVVLALGTNIGYY